MFRAIGRGISPIEGNALSKPEKVGCVIDLIGGVALLTIGILALSHPAIFANIPASSLPYAIGGAIGGGIMYTIISAQGLAVITAIGKEIFCSNCKPKYQINDVY